MQQRAEDQYEDEGDDNGIPRAVRIYFFLFIYTLNLDVLQKI